MRMSVGLAKRRRNESNARRRPGHEGRRTSKRCKLRWTARRSHGNEESRLPLKLLETQRRLPRRKNRKHLPNVPRLVDAALRRALVEDAFDESTDQLMFSYWDAVLARQSHGENGAMKTNRSIRQTLMKKEGQVVKDHRQIDGIERNPSGAQKVFECAPGRIVAGRCGTSPASGDKSKNGVGEAGGVEPPEILQAAR